VSSGGLFGAGIAEALEGIGIEIAFDFAGFGFDFRLCVLTFPENLDVGALGGE